MKAFILLFAISLQLTSCSLDQSKEIQAKKPIQSDSMDEKLKFESAVGVIFQDSRGNFWFGSREEGVCKYDGHNFTYYTTKDGLLDDQIRSIDEDSIGNIWFTTAHGISKYNNGLISSYRININTIKTGDWKKSDDITLLSAGNNEGVLSFDGINLQYLPFPSTKQTNPYNVYHVTCISEGMSGTIWFGTYAGVFGYDGNDFTIINDETLGLNNETGVIHVRSILEDSKGRLWIGNNGMGVLLKHGKEIKNFSDEHNLIHPTSTRRGDKSKPGTLEHIFAIEEDAEGNIWFGDRDTGAWKFDGKTMTNYTTKDGLTDDFVISIYKDNNDELWFGLEDGNLLKFNGKEFDEVF